MDQSKYILAVVSTFSILVPICFCGWAIYRRARALLWLFLSFLVIGFSVDFLSWYSWILSSEKESQMANNLMALSRWMYEAYPIVEGMFFFWLLHRVSKNPTIRIASNIALILVFPVWLAFEWVLPSEEVFGIQEFGIFHMLYRVVAAFLASYTLLLSLERDEPILVNPHFWYLGGILLYNFTTFFVLLIRGTNVAQQLWYLHNVMNIITYLFYSVGFYYAVKSTHLSNRGT